MIHIEQNQPLKDDPRVLVAVPTGDYDEMDLLECYAEGGNPDVPTCMYQAQYIVFGRPIYEQTEELTEDQVAALLSNRPAHEVINNRKLIDGKNRASKYIGRVIGRKGKLGKKDLKAKSQADAAATSTPVFVDPEPVIEPKIERPDDAAVSTSTPDNASVADPVATSSPDAVVEPSSLSNIDTSTTTAPVVDVASSTPDVSTTTLPVIEEVTSSPIIDVMPSSTAPVIEPTSTSTATSTTDEIVAYAKRKIARRLGL
jgi:hypothetical protein